MNPAQAITNSRMQAIELNSEYLGVSHLQLMETVGSQVAREVASRLSRKPKSQIEVVAGTGKNGGDGFATARHLAAMGHKVKLTLIGKPSDVSDDAAKIQLGSALQMSESIEFQYWPDSSSFKPLDSEIIVDALLGTGVKGDLHQPILGAVRAINKSKGLKISVDLPSGLDTDTGQPHGDAVKADVTLSLHKLKTGLEKNPEYSGEVVVVPIGIPPEAETYAGPGDFKTVWRERPPESHKGDFGRLIIIGGSENFTGAPTYAALAATKLGTDLVYVAAPEKTAEIIASYSPDLITIRLPGAHIGPASLPEIGPWLRKADALVLGPGIGLQQETHEIVWRIISEAEALRKPMVLDADGLKIFAEKKRKLKTQTVLTPHTREFELLAGEKVGANTEARQDASAKLSRETGATIILKGHVDIIAGENNLRLNNSGNPYMTVGGTGDVLTGVVGALVAQHVEPFQASVASAFLNGLAGDLLIAEQGPAMTASALVEYLPKAIKYCIEGPPYPAVKK